MPQEIILDPSTFDMSRLIADRASIRAFNPQRFEMEQLDGIFFLDADRKLIAGYKDVRPDEFWARGHMPSFPLFPGALMCEAAAQLCSYYVRSQKIIADDQILGFGGLEDVRFRQQVRPGDRFVLVARGERLKRMATRFTVQGFVGANLAFHGQVIGVPLSIEGG